MNARHRRTEQCFKQQQDRGLTHIKYAEKHLCPELLAERETLQQEGTLMVRRSCLSTDDKSCCCCGVDGASVN